MAENDVLEIPNKGALKIMSCLFYRCGGNLYSLEHLTKSRVLMIFLRCCFVVEVIWIFVFSVDILIMFRGAIASREMILSLNVSIYILSTTIRCLSFYLIWYYEEDLNDLLEFLVIRVIETQKEMRESLRQKIIKGIAKPMTVFIVFICAKMFGYHYYAYFVSGMLPVPTTMPISTDSHILIQAIYVFLGWYCAITSFLTPVTVQWLFMLYMSLLSMEFDIAHEQFKCIIGLIEPDSENGTRLETIPEDEEPMSSVAYEIHVLKRKFKEADQLLNSWIQAQIELNKLTQKLNKIFGFWVALEAFHAYMLMISFASLNSKMPGSVVGTQIADYALSNLLAYFFVCYEGQKLIDKSYKVLEGGMTMGWYLYPVKFQKKLLTIVTFVQAKPREINYHNYFRLDMLAFYNVVVMSYNLITFLRSTIK